MNNNKAGSYQKLRSLYEKKFLSENGSDNLQNNVCSIRFKRWAQACAMSQKVDISINSTQDSTAVDQSSYKLSLSKIESQKRQNARLSINIDYTQISACRQPSARNSSSGNRITLTSDGRRSSRKSRNFKTLIFPNTSRDPPSNPGSSHKKYSLIQMIDQIKKQKRRNTSKIIFDGGTYTEGKYQKTCEDGLQRSIGKFKAALHSFKVFNKTYRQTTNLARTTKDDLIDPWIVNQNEQELRKYY